MWVEPVVGLLKGTPGHTQGLSGVWSWLVIVSNFTSQFETPLHSLLQVSHECLWTIIEVIVSLCVLEREQLLREKWLSWENRAGDSKRKTTATNIPRTGFLRGKKKIADAACLKSGCRAVCLSLEYGLGTYPWTGLSLSKKLAEGWSCESGMSKASLFGEILARLEAVLHKERNWETHRYKSLPMFISLYFKNPLAKFPIHYSVK